MDSSLPSFIWSVADLLRGPYKRSEFGRVILPFTVLRRLDCVLDGKREKIRKAAKKYEGSSAEVRHRWLLKAAGESFYNTSELDLESVAGNAAKGNQAVALDLSAYTSGFSANAREIMEHFRFEAQIERLVKHDRLYLVTKKFAQEIDLHPNIIDNRQMGLIFEELIRRFAEDSNETAGEHFTPREVIKLMVNVLFNEDGSALAKPGVIRTLFDPACGTGGMLSVAEEHLKHLNRDIRVEVFGQELNPESYAICKADMMLKGHDPGNVRLGCSFTADGFSANRFDYCISNPPFGVDWKAAEEKVREEAALGDRGRFGAGVPKISDGALLFLLHMLSKRKPKTDGGTRIAVVLSRSPLYTGGPTSGENGIRKWVLDNDWLETVIALPSDLFYNTAIPTYIWVLTNRKPPERVKKVQLIDATDLYATLSRGIGFKRRELTEAHVEAITQLYGDFDRVASDRCKVVSVRDFYFRELVIEQPLRLRFSLDGGCANRFAESKAFLGLAKRDAPRAEALKQVIAQLVVADSDPPQTQEEVEARLRKGAKHAGVRLTKTLTSAFVSAASQKDPTAPIAKDEEGKPVPDPDFRDKEFIAETESAEEFFKEEISKFVPEAWYSMGDARKVEIPFHQHFSSHVERRPLSDVARDFQQALERCLSLLEAQP